MAELRDEEVVDKTRLPEHEVELGFTKSMGKGTYEFLRVDIRRRTHTRPGETDDEAFERLYSEVEARLVEKVEELDNDLGPRGRDSSIHSNRK